jgi:F-type H+-transporting ATPase subunit gamma
VASLEDLQQELAGLHDLRTIVRTMKALSAARIRQYEHAVAALAEYDRTVRLGLQVVLRSVGRPPAPARARGRHRAGAVVFGSDHGLCGRFNEEVAAFVADHPLSAAEPLVIAVGARAADRLQQSGVPVAEDLPLPASPVQITRTVQDLLLRVDGWRERHQVHELVLFYNRHGGSRGYQPRALALLPVDLRQFHGLGATPWPSRSVPTFSMQPDVLASRLLHQYLFVSVFRACAESQASEHAARLDAMHSAQHNVDERLESLTMAFRRARQDAITAELLDVVSGFEALTPEPTPGGDEP